MKIVAVASLLVMSFTLGASAQSSSSSANWPEPQPRVIPKSGSNAPPAEKKNRESGTGSLRDTDAARTFKATLDSDEPLFAMMVALNACGYDQDLGSSDQLRAKVRSEVDQKLKASQSAELARQAFCRFHEDHKQSDAAHDLAQYISLALFLGDPPAFTPSILESDLPPDASYVLGAVPLLRNFYSAAGLHDIWETHRREYDALIERFHDPIAGMIFRTDLYLKLQLSGYLGRRFIVYVEPLVAPNAINARNYGDDYYMVVSPAADGLPVDAIRHTYLHYVLDPYALKHGTLLKKLEPLLRDVATAPMDQSFKNDIGLMSTESLIRAIEARMMPGGRAAEPEREQHVDQAMKEGFVLARYFYGALEKFEHEPAGIKDAYANWIYEIDLGHERKQAQETVFAKQATPELLGASHPQQHVASLLDRAEQKLIDHDVSGAKELAQQALNSKDDDPARALFILARASAESGDMPGAQNYFQRTLDLAHEPRLVAWSHIYLGRILDIQAQREAAVAQYRAALAAGDPTPDTKTAAERGLAQPYQVPGREQQPQ